MPTRAEEIAALPTGTKLQPLNEMPGFAEWRDSPVTLELLARVDVKIADGVKEVDKVKPCACGAEQPAAVREHRAFTGGLIQGLKMVAGALAGRVTP